jgi:hypothetical protein
MEIWRGADCACAAVTVTTAGAGAPPATQCLGCGAPAEHATPPEPVATPYGPAAAAAAAVLLRPGGAAALAAPALPPGGLLHVGLASSPGLGVVLHFDEAGAHVDAAAQWPVCAALPLAPYLARVGWTSDDWDEHLVARHEAWLEAGGAPAAYDARHRNCFHYAAAALAGLADERRLRAAVHALVAACEHHAALAALLQNHGALAHRLVSIGKTGYAGRPPHAARANEQVHDGLFVPAGRRRRAGRALGRLPPRVPSVPRRRAACRRAAVLASAGPRQGRLPRRPQCPVGCSLDLIAAVVE